MNEYVAYARNTESGCNSLTKHIDELRIVLSNQCVDILAINET